MKSRPGLILILALTGAGFAVWLNLPGRDDSQRSALRQRETATRVLAEYIADRNPGDSVLVASNPFTKTEGRDPGIYLFDEAGIAGLNKGFPDGTSLTIDVPELRRQALSDPGSVYVRPQTTTPLSFLVAEDSFDQLSHKFPDCKIIVSLIGIPVGFQESEIWRNRNGTKLALIFPDWRVFGKPQTVHAALKSGQIIAAIMNKPGAPLEVDSRSSGYREEFSKRFILLTPDNADTMIQKHPELF